MTCVGISHLKRGWRNCLIIGSVEVSINLLKVEIWSPLSRKRMTERVLDAWSQLYKENIIKSSRYCGLNLANDGTEDDFLHFLKNGQPCETGRQKLNSQLSILVDEKEAVNPFISPCDKEDANEEMNVIKDETNEEIIMYICSFFDCLSCVSTISTLLWICK